jgi:predicted transcriptional regulator
MALIYAEVIQYSIRVKYRSRTDIIAMILRTAVNGATKTRIMYGAYLSYAQVKEYLSFLIEKNLITYEEGAGLYRLTENGMKLLRVYEGISDMISVNGEKAPEFP